MLPSMYGCSAQQDSGPSYTLTIDSVTFVTQRYGTTIADVTPIGASEKITTILNGDNSFTFGADGLAQYYSNSNTSQQVFHSMQVGYSANFDTSVLPADGSCTFTFETTMGNAPADSGLSTWPLEGNVSGSFLPSSAKEDGVIITPEGMTQAEVYPNPPVVGEDNIGLQNKVLVKGGGSTTSNNTNNLAFIPFAAQNLGTSSSFDLVIKIKLADGSTVSSPAQTITIPAGAVKTNLVAGLGINSYTTTTAGYGEQLAGAGVTNPVVAIDPSQVLVSALDTANSFTTPNVDVGIGMAQGYQNPPADIANQVLHSWQVNLDTSQLTLSDYPASALIVQYLFSWDADATNISPGDGIFWDAETGEASIPSGNVGSVFTITADDELDSINTDTLIPFASIDFPIIGDSNRDYNTSWKAFSPSLEAPVSDNYIVNLQVRIQKTDGSFTESPVVALRITDNGVVPQMTL